MKVKVTSLIGLIAVLASLQLTACGQKSRPKPAHKEAVINDSSVSFEEALGTQDIPDYIRTTLSLVNVRYYSFDGRVHHGQLVIHKDLQTDILEIFQELEKNKFPIAKVIPISKYQFSDEASMADNNTSAFNYRLIAGSPNLSNHALGRAVDINPFLNPYIRSDTVEPLGAKYDPNVLGTIVADGIIVKAFKQRGWFWGGDWKSLKDYQHFEKVEPKSKQSSKQ